MTTPLSDRITAIDWRLIAQRLDNEGFATTGTLLNADECSEIAALYDRDDRFRKRIVMAQHNFGLGEYKYFAYPLPKAVQALRQ
ncbi:MAG TPA: hypothetical protein VKR31_02755, partial [Rhizomicrobium sp.]|nr:hypothetical protein [Rhizomicrobium sp.]